MARHALLLGAALAILPAAGTHADLFDDAADCLERSVTPQRDGSHIVMVSSLRQLRDPAMAALFHRLLDEDDWALQAHAALALAELDGNRLDGDLVRRIDARGRERAIAQAIEDEMLGDGCIDALLAWNDLEPVPRLMLIGERYTRGGAVDVEMLRALASADDLAVAASAAALLAQLGEPAAFAACVSRLEGGPRAEYRRGVPALLDLAWRLRLDALAPWIESIVEAEDAPPDIVEWGIATLLEIDPERGLRLWRTHLGTAPSYSQSIRYGLLLLRTEPPVGAEWFDLLPRDDELLRAMATVGRRLGRGRDPVPALIALLDLNHLRTAEWVLECCERLPEEHAVPVLLHILDRVDLDETRGRQERTAHAVGAVVLLDERRPDVVRRRLTEAEEDGPLQQALLLGLFARIDTDVKAIAAVERIGAGRADSLALLLLARGSGGLQPEDMHRLGLIAAGGGRLGGPLQTQAAWLYLRHGERVEWAMRRIFEP